MILGFLFFIFLKHCKALSTEKYRRYINIYYYCIIIIIIIIIITNGPSELACTQPGHMVK